MIFLAAVTHDVRSNTLEAVWLEEVFQNGILMELKPVKRRNYSAEQKADFENDVGVESVKYITMAAW